MGGATDAGVSGFAGGLRGGVETERRERSGTVGFGGAGPIDEGQASRRGKEKEQGQPEEKA